MLLKRMAVMGLTVSLIVGTAVPLRAEGLFDNGEGGEDSGLAGEYLADIIEYINENYIGDEITTQELVEAAIAGMAHAMDDYSEYYTKEQYDEVMKSIAKELYSPRIEFVIGEDKYPVVTALQEGSMARNDGMKVGDKITAINGMDIRGFSHDEVMGLITSNKSTAVNMTLLRRKKVLEVNITLILTKITTVENRDISTLIAIPKGTNASRVGYLKINSIGEGTAEEFKSAIRELKRNRKDCLILDLRGNMGGYVEQAVEICKSIVPKGNIITTKDKQGNTTVYKSELEDLPFKKMIVLTDGMTASASEIIVSALQDSGAALVVGNRTYGKGVMQSIVELNDMGILKMTAFEYYSRNGRKINGIGVSPNVEVDDVLFVSIDDKTDSAKLGAALNMLGFEADSNIKTKNSIGAFQQQMGLPITYVLDEATVSAINIKLYTELINVDRILLEGYINIIS